MSRDDKSVRLRPLRQEITDLPNLITLARIALVPLVLVTMNNYSPRWSALSALIFAAAAFTDFLDGYLARRLGLVTIVGKFLDPLADKIIVHATLLALVAENRVAPWVVILLLVRDFAVNGLRTIASTEGLVIAAGQLGKIKTALQLIGICFLLIHFEYEVLFLERSIDYHEAGTVLIYVSLVMSLLSALEYFQFFMRAADKKAKELKAKGIDRKVLKSRAKRRRRRIRKLRRTVRKERKQSRRKRTRSTDANRD